MSYEDQLYREATGEHEPKLFNPFGDEIEHDEPTLESEFMRPGALEITEHENEN